MISVSFLTMLAWAPFILAAFGVYYLICWFLPKDMCFHSYDTVKIRKNRIIAHAIVFTIAWMIWAIYFFCEGKEKYIKTHVEIQQVQE